MDSTDRNAGRSQFNIVLAFIGVCLAFTYFLPNESVNCVLSFLIGPNSLMITVNRLILVVIAGVSLAGTLWFLHASQPTDIDRHSLRAVLPHLVIPIFTSAVLTYTLSQMVRSGWWWVVYAIGMVLVGTVLLAERADLTDIENRTPIPMVSLSALAIGLYLLGMIVLRTIGPRVYVLVPLVAIASAFISLRFIGLRTAQKPAWELILVIVLLVSQTAAALYYLFINALQFGLILTGLLYGLATLSVGLQAKKRGFALLAEPLVMLLVAGLLTGLSFLL